MQTHAAPAEFVTTKFLGRGATEGGEPDKRHGEHAAVGEYDVHHGIVEVQTLCQRRSWNVGTSKSSGLVFGRAAGLRVEMLIPCLQQIDPMFRDEALDLF
jgi:hypothetical protein